MQKYITEFVGTMFFVYVILTTGNPVAIGAALALVIFVAAKRSGGHVNPAVSVVMASTGRLPMNDLVPYLLAQVFGGLAAVELHKRVKM